MLSIEYFGKKTNKKLVIVIPGIDGSVGSVKPVVEELAEKRQVALVNYTKENNDLLDSLVEEIVAIVNEEINEPFHLLGQSIGTVMAALSSAKLGEQVAKVALMCTFTKLNWNKLRLSNFFMAAMPDFLYKASSGPTMAYVCGPVGDGKNHPFFESSKAAPKKNIVKRTAWQIGRDFAKDLEKAEKPVLIIMGEKDRFVRNPGKEIDRLREIFRGKDAIIKTTPKGGHVFLNSSSIKFAVSELNKFYDN